MRTDIDASLQTKVLIRFSHHPLGRLCFKSVTILAKGEIREKKSEPWLEWWYWWCIWRSSTTQFSLVYSFPTYLQMLVVFKSAPILKRALKVKHAMMQLYVLKLLKMQTKYLGRQWRKSNMKTMSAIYQKVRHRLNDDWAYGNGKMS